MRTLFLLAAAMPVAIPAIAEAQNRAGRERVPAPPPIVRVVPPQETIVSSYGSWSVSDAGDHTAAYTSNQSGSVFGMICGTTCVIYLNMQRPCDHGADYPAMIASNEDSQAITLRCFRLDDRYIVTTEATDYFVDVVARGGEIGFAVPIRGARFSVSRFSLTGGLEAMTDAVAIAEQRRSQSQDGLRDFTI